MAYYIKDVDFIKQQMFLNKVSELIEHLKNFYVVQSNSVSNIRYKVNQRYIKYMEM